MRDSDGEQRQAERDEEHKTQLHSGNSKPDVRVLSGYNPCACSDRTR